MPRNQIIASLSLAGLLAAGASELYAQYPPGRDPYRSGTLFGPDGATVHTQAFGEIAKSARTLAKKRAKDLPEAVRLLGEIERDATFLQNQVTQWVNRSRGSYAGAPPELDPYFQHIRRIAKKIENTRKLTDPQLLEVLQNISKDLNAKALNCRHSADGLGKQITVTAHTLKGTDEIRGFEVYFAPMALLDNKAEHQKFPELSSPTTLKNLPPGYYAVWLKRNNATNAHTAQTIGGDGQPKFRFDISVPEAFPPTP